MPHAKLLSFGLQAFCLTTDGVKLNRDCIQVKQAESPVCLSNPEQLKRPLNFRFVSGGIRGIHSRQLTREILEHLMDGYATSGDKDRKVDDCGKVG